LPGVRELTKDLGVRSLYARALLGVIALGPWGCIQAALSAGQPTALERQLLGAYEELDEDLVHASSVRDQGLPGPGPLEALKQEALQARAVQRFNEGDLEELKAAGCVAETLGAELAARPCEAVQRDPTWDRRRTRIVEEENRARATLMRWAAHEVARREGRAAPTPREVAEVRGAYRRLLEEAAQPGHLMEVAPGEFRPAPSR
jgi:hypothetical protein